MHMVIYLLYFKQESCNVGVKTQSPTSVAPDHPAKRNKVHIHNYYCYIVQSFSFSTVAIDKHGNASLCRALSIENDLCVSFYLQLQCLDNSDSARVWLRYTVFLKKSVWNA